MKSIGCYDIPRYWDLAFDEDTKLEADFVVAAVRKYCDFEPREFLEPGCGGGRLMREFGRRGYSVTGWDISSVAVEFANSRLQAERLPGTAIVADMAKTAAVDPVDAAYCLVNTFRHLLTEDAAVQHLRNIAASLRPGGLYIVGMHLFPPDADEEDEEEWSYSHDNVTVQMQLTVHDCSREKRTEFLRFVMTVDDSEADGVQQFESDYQMRLYESGQFLNLLRNVPEFKLLDVYDFWYDISEPLMLTDELGDTVFILQRRA